MEKLFHMIKLMNFVVDECDKETLLHDKANTEKLKVYIISDLDMKDELERSMQWMITHTWICLI